MHHRLALWIVVCAGTPALANPPGGPTSALGGPQPPLSATSRSATAQGRLLREGTVLVSRRGHAARDADGRWTFHFDPDADGRAEPPMRLLPCEIVGGIERLTGSASRSPTLVLTGRVFVHRGTNVFLPTVPPQVERASPLAEPALRPSDSEQRSGDDGDPLADLSDDPTTEALLRALEPAGRVREPLPAPPASGDGAAPTPGAPGSIGPVPEGTYLAHRRGRVVHSSSGELLLTFDAEADGPSDGPMVLLPCLNLEGIEKAARAAGEDVTFTVSGIVTTQGARTYLLPTLYRVNRGTDVRPTQ